MATTAASVEKELSFTGPLSERNALSRSLLSSQGSLVNTANKSTTKQSLKTSDAYLSELLSYSLDRLRKEPELLGDEEQQIKRNIQATSVANHGAFIETAHCLSTINTELSTVCSHLEVLLKDIPKLASDCESFSARSAQILNQYTQNKQLANAQSSVLEILEIPQLMDTCVRNGVYDEALDLQAFVSRLGLLHADIPAVRMLMKQVADVGQTMLHQLLSRLRSSLQLPECLRTMGYLRRIAAFSEPELRLQFLSCRDEWLSQLVSELEEGDSYEYLKRLTDVYRLHLFDVIMQYRAIFFDAPAQVDTGVHKTASSAAAGAAPNIKESTVLYSWVQYRLTLYLQALKKHLPNVTEGGNLASVLEHCMYCGSSLSRVGLDFQGLLHPLFESAVLHLFAGHLSAAVEAFNSRLESHKWVAMPAPTMYKTRQQEQARAAAAAASGSEGGAEATGATGPLLDRSNSSFLSGGGAAGLSSGPEDLSPPYVTMEHLPLAVFTNAVLSAFNELRHCALLSLSRPAASLLQECAEHAAASLLHYLHTRVLSESELQLFRSAVKTMMEVLLPYFAACFARVFAAGGLAKLDMNGCSSILAQILQEA